MYNKSNTSMEIFIKKKCFKLGFKNIKALRISQFIRKSVPQKRPIDTKGSSFDHFRVSKINM